MMEYEYPLIIKDDGIEFKFIQKVIRLKNKQEINNESYKTDKTNNKCNDC